MAVTGLTLDNPVFSAYLFYSMLLSAKLLLMSYLTAYYRFAKKAYANIEDANMHPVSKAKGVVFNDPDVERIKRNHVNDMENILPFLLVGLCYVTINPSITLALFHFRTFTIARFLHMITYQYAIPQPARAICWLAGTLVTISMITQNVMATF